MTAEKGIEFIQNNGCPECQSLDIYYGEMIVMEGAKAVQEACCQECGHEWHDIYSYLHSVHDKTSKPKEVMRVADI